VIIVTEGLSIFELMSDYCVSHNKCLLYFNNPLWASFDDEKKSEIIEFYSDYAPDDIIEEIRQGRNCVIEYNNDDVAVLNAAEWFPPRKYCPSPEYYFRVLVMDTSSDIVFENLDPSLTEPEE